MAQPSQYGRVTSVFIDADQNEVLVSVVTGPNREPSKMKFETPKTGVWFVPSEGDLVEVHSINGTRVARAPVNPSPDPIPTDLSEGDICFKLNANTELHFSVQDDGTVNVDVTADGDISVSATGDVTVNGESITLGNGGGAESLAVQSHTHPYSWTDGGGSGDTGIPNEAGTSRTKAE
jgi:hypothetical protein